ncbi:response regulator [Halobacteriales archaeon QS_4_69_34]|nr:MAG: response regulator [Halobacteriales archaeon QS_4_69_34]
MPPHILLADDEVQIRQLLEFKLQGKGFEVTVVDDGAECLDHLEGPDELPDAVLLDVMMPQVDGFRALETIRDTLSEELPVIMLTTRSREPDAIRGLENGANEYIEKPFSPDEVIARVERHLQ